MNTISRLTVLCCVAGLLAWLFAGILFGGGLFAFRDAAHYYYPLYGLVNDEWSAGRAPLWNPYENLGQPLAADPTAAAFYPGKLVFLLPLGYAWDFRLYVVGHVLLAAAAAYWLARRFGTGVAAAGVCAISYAFSGSVLFQYCNVVFLVGAAWLPVAVLAAERMLGEAPRDFGRRAAWATGLGLVLAMMVLGGDPQMAYNAGVLAVLYAAIVWWRARREGRGRKAEGGAAKEGARARKADGAVEQPPGNASGEGPAYALTSLVRRLIRRDTRHDLPSPVAARSSPLRPPPPAFRSSLLPRVALLALAALAALVLAAVQVVPSAEMAARSDRRADAWPARFLAKAEPGTHAEHTYQFSVGPWRLAEYVWPNLLGRQFPVHRRWANAIPAEGRVWTPSLYMGVVPLLLAFLAMRFRTADPRAAWLTWSALLAVAAALGWYGVGWLVQEVRVAAGGDPRAWLVGAPFGGLYWLMTLVLPGYTAFRYPAKLLVVAALGLSVLAAVGFDRVLIGGSPRFRRGLAAVTGLSACGAIAALAIRPFWAGWLAGVKPDAMFGPLDAAGAWRDLFFGFVQTAVVCTAWWLLLRVLARGATADATSPTSGATAGLSSSDGTNVGKVSPGTENPRRETPLALVALVLVAVDLAVANGWLVASAPERLWHARSAMAEAIRGRSLPGSMPRVYRHPIWMPERWKTTSSADRLAEWIAWDRDTLFPKCNLPERIALTQVEGAMAVGRYDALLARTQGAAALGRSDYAILPPEEPLRDGRPIATAARDARLWQSAVPAARAWIVHGDGPVEAVESARARAAGHESCRVTDIDPQRVEVDAELAAPGRVVLADQFYPGWTADVTSGGGPARRVESEPYRGVMRAVSLPAGRHRVVYRYRPASFVWGAAVSAAGWASLVVVSLFWWTRRRRRPIG